MKGQLWGDGWTLSLSLIFLRICLNNLQYISANDVISVTRVVITLNVIFEHISHTCHDKINHIPGC